jgi:CDP-paratose 2-epimerase
MPAAIVTGLGALIGSESVQHFVRAGYGVIGIENDMRARFLGSEASTLHVFEPWRDPTTTRSAGSMPISSTSRRSTAPSARPRARWSWPVIRRHSRLNTGPLPTPDGLTVNANGSLRLSEAMRRHALDTTVIFCSTNKVYGDHPNRPQLKEIGSGDAFMILYVWLEHDLSRRIIDGSTQNRATTWSRRAGSC